MHASKRWVRVAPDDVARLDGSFDGGHWPTIHDVKVVQDGLSADEVWQLVRDGRWVAYRAPSRLQLAMAP